MSPALARGRILLVEDDAAVREAMLEVLGEQGYDVVVAVDGAEGLRLAAAQREPCPILLDWRMPGISGPVFLGRLRQLPRGAEFPVILSTGDRDAAADAIPGTVAGVLSKPFELDALLAMLERVARGG
ncbi:MAG TPA: response regulator [Myxococcaceae bacterium]|nr:response regulator [Myxococcaceae bacterium]